MKNLKLPLEEEQCIVHVGFQQECRHHGPNIIIVEDSFCVERIRYDKDDLKLFVS